MSTSSDGTVTLRGSESSVLVQDAPPDSALVDASTVVEDGRRRVEVRFGGRSAGAESGDAFVVTPADAGNDGGGTEGTDGTDETTHTVGGPADLTGYGVALDKVFDAADAPLLVRVDSLTTLLQHTDTTDAFRFVHVLCGRVAREDAVLVAGIDGDAHDRQTVATLLQPFDVTIVETDPGLRVRRRG